MFRTIATVLAALPLVACTSVDVQLHATEGGVVYVDGSEEVGGVDCAVWNDGEGMTGDCEADDDGTILSYEGEAGDAIGLVLVELTAQADDGYTFSEWSGCEQVDEESGLVFMEVDADDPTVCLVYHQEVAQKTSMTLADTADEANVIAVFEAN